MKKYIFILLIGFGVLCSCNSQEEEIRIWGELEYYDSFLWSKYVPDTLRHILKYEFNDCASELQEPVIFSLYMMSEDGGNCRKTSNQDVELYIDGVLSPDNTFQLSPNSNKNEVEFGIVLKNKLLYEKDIDRDFKFVFKVEDNPGIDRINNYSINSSNTPLLDENKDAQTPIVVKVKHVSNRLRVCIDSILSFIGILVICVLVIWFLILKGLNYPKLDVAVDINGAYYLHKSKNRYRMIVLCDGSYDKRQSYLNKLFTGEVFYSVNDMWSDGPVSIVPSGKNVRIKLDGNEKYTIKPYDLTLEKDVEYKITNSSKQSIQIVIS